MDNHSATTNADTRDLQEQPGHVQGTRMQRDMLANRRNAQNLLPNTNTTFYIPKPPHQTIPPYPSSVQTITPQIPPKHLINSNTLPSMLLPYIQPPPIIFLSEDQPVTHHPRRLRNQVETFSSDDTERELHNSRKVVEARDFQSFKYEDLCLHPNIQPPHGFEVPKFNIFYGKGNPISHLKDYCSRLVGFGHNEALRMRLFIQSLSGAALDWYTMQDFKKWYTWEDMARDFVDQYKFNIQDGPALADVQRLEKMSHESFQEFATRWRSEASEMNPQLSEKDLISCFVDMKKEEDLQGGKFTNHLPEVHNARTSNKFGMLEDSDNQPEHQNDQQFQKIHHLSVQSNQRPPKKMKSRTFSLPEESLTDMFEKLKAVGLIHPRNGWIPKKLPPGFDWSKTCAYHSNIQGHSTEDCLALKHKIQSMIEKGKVIADRQQLYIDHDSPILRDNQPGLPQRRLKRKRQA